MSTITFDTFKFVDRLEKAGLTREQAAAIVEAQKDAFSEALEMQLATKADVVVVERRMDGIDAKLDRIETKVSGELALVKWMLAALIALAVANFGKQFF